MKKKTMPRVLALLLAVALVCASMIAVPSTEAQAAAAKPTSIKLKTTKQTLYVGGKKGSFNLEIKTVKPSKASKKAKDYTYKSSNTKVATVKNGKVTAKKAGNAKITVTSKKNKKAKATCTVTVKDGVKKIETASKLTMQKGKSVTLNLGFTPSNAPNAKVKEMKFSTSKKSVATVSSKGKIKAKKAGKANITVQPKDGSVKAVKVAVTVKKKITAVTKLTLNKKTLDLTLGGSEKLVPTFKPKKPTSKTLYWVSKNTNIATVNAKNGTVTAKGVGTTTITAYTTDSSNKKATCTVNVLPVMAEGIVLDQTAMEFAVGDVAPRALTAAIAPENVTDPTVTWTSDNPAVATLTTVEGVPMVEGVLAVSGAVQTVMVAPGIPGTAKIIATTVNGLQAVCTVTVAAPVQAPSEERADETVGVSNDKVITLKKSATEYRVDRKDKDSVKVASATVKEDYAKLLEELRKDIWNYTDGVAGHNFFAAKWDKVAEKVKEFGIPGLAEFQGELDVEVTSKDVITVKAGQKTATITRTDVGYNNNSCDLVIASGEKLVKLQNVKTSKAADGTVKITAVIPRGTRYTDLTVELKEGEMKAYLYNDPEAGNIVKFVDTEDAYVITISGAQYLHMKNEFNFTLGLDDIAVYNVWNVQ